MRAAIALSFCLIAVILLETTAQEPSVTGRRNVDFDEKTKIPDWNGQKIGSVCGPGMKWKRFSDEAITCECEPGLFLELDATYPGVNVFTAKCTKCDGPNMCTGVATWKEGDRCYINLQGADKTKVSKDRKCL